MKGKNGMKRMNIQKRKTKETEINVNIHLDDSKESKISTPNAFFTHMLELFAKHGNFHLECDIRGDTEVDLHHTVEDTGIVLGKAFSEALGDKKGIERYGLSYVPMDETLVRVVVDLSGRPFFYFEADSLSGKIGEFDMEHCKHFFRAFAHHLSANLHVSVLYGDDKHHIVEAIFKATSRALKGAIAITGKEIPSTKGIL